MEHLITVKTSDQLYELAAHIAENDYIAYDIETTGLEISSEIIGFSVSGALDIAYYVILSEWDGEKLVKTPIYSAAKGIIELLKDKNLVMHNGIFDCALTEAYTGVSLIESLHTDTMILAHLLNENRHNGLKELGISIFGEDADKEKKDMVKSILERGGKATKSCYELYKADPELIAKYGAKDALLTLKLFYQLVPELYDQGLDKFFYEEESMPLLRGATYQLNTTGLRIDAEKLQTLRAELEAEGLMLRASIKQETDPLVCEKYPGTNKTNVFNIGSNNQLAWLLFEKLGEDFNLLTDEGKELCKALSLKLPYALKDKREFIRTCKQNKDRVWKGGSGVTKTGKSKGEKKVKDPWCYMACGKDTLVKFANKYKWVKCLLQLKKSQKLLETYVIGIQERMKYNVIRPSFLQHGTTSGRYSSRNPNFQNLPRDDKRVKACIVSRPGKVFVGADYSQLEPRVFASLSQDESLMASFKSDNDFYSVIGMTAFNISDAVPLKDGSPEAFGVKYKKLRDIAKVVALSSTYGTTAPKMAPAIGKSIDEAQEIIDMYFESFPKVKEFMTSCHNAAMGRGQVLSLYGRPRRMPAAKDFREIYGGNPNHSKMLYEHRNLLNLSVNHVVQSSAASIVNRAAIAICKELNLNGITSAKIVLQVHDQLILECREEDANKVKIILQKCMENSVKLPGVNLEAIPFISNNLADQK